MAGENRKKSGKPSYDRARYARDSRAGADGNAERGMAERRIGVAAPPGQNGGYVNDQIARLDEPTTDGGQHSQRAGAFALLRGARKCEAGYWTSAVSHRQVPGRAKRTASRVYLDTKAAMASAAAQ